MKFVVVNGRTPSPQSFCALCCEPIGESYLRELTTRLSYCDHECYVGEAGLSSKRYKTLDAWPSAQSQGA
jgi:hypothetical protein